MNARTEHRPLGMILGMPFDEYHAVDAMSASGMRYLARSPWHYRNRVPITPTRSMLNGTLAHCAVLEPAELERRYVFVPDDAPRRPTEAQWNAKTSNDSSRAAKEWWTDFLQRAEQRTVIAANDYATTQQQLAALRANPWLHEHLASGSSEVSLFWVDRESGVYCKARLDHLHITADKRVVILDLKATADDTPSGFARSVASMGYHRQRAHYINGFEAVTRQKVDDFVFAVVSSVPPILATPYRLLDEAAQQGAEEVAELLEKYAKCQRSGDWHAYSPQQQMIDLPAWAKRSGEVEVSYAD